MIKGYGKLNKWILKIVTININKKNKNVGIFKDIVDEASKVYDEASKLYHGKFTCLNFSGLT
jgi:hypothetical protein